MAHHPKERIQSQLIRFQVDHSTVEGYLTIPPEAKNIVIFAHGSGSSKDSKLLHFSLKPH
jgi:hypothetical protein